MRLCLRLLGFQKNLSDNIAKIIFWTISKPDNNNKNNYDHNYNYW